MQDESICKRRECRGLQSRGSLGRASAMSNPGKENYAQPRAGGKTSALRCRQAGGCNTQERNSIMHAIPIVNAFRVTILFCVATVSLCSVGCGKKSQPNTETPAGAPAQPSSTSAQPSSTSAQPVAPAAPTGPVPSFSAANKVGLYAYPGKGQSHDQQLIDESDCYNSAQQQTGVNADTPAPQPPSSADARQLRRRRLCCAATKRW